MKKDNNAVVDVIVSHTKTCTRSWPCRALANLSVT